MYHNYINVWSLLGLEPWASGVRLVYQTGYHFEGILEGPVGVLKPQERQNITVALKAPSVSGVYKTQWRLADPSGCFFGGIVTIDSLTLSSTHFRDTIVSSKSG